MSRPLRFRPPDVVLSPEVAWVLLRAFGPPEAPPPEGFRPEAVGTLARRLDVAARIATRIPRDMLCHEVGAEGTNGLIAARGVVALGNELHHEVALEVAACAKGVGAPLVFLKGVALGITHRTPLDSRASSDVDVLVADHHLEAMAEALRRHGFRSDGGGPPYEHQLPALHRRPGECVDVHRFLPGIRLPGEGTFAGALGLARRGLLQGVPELPGECFVPAPSLLAAHALAHGVSQNGFAPGSYPGTRMLADLLDLGMGDPDAGSLSDEVSRLVSHVRPSEVQAVSALCSGLRTAEALPGVLRRNGPPAEVLLAHIVAGVTDPAYRESLKVRALGSGPSRLPPSLAWARDAARALYPSRAEVEGLHGGPQGALRAAGLRLARPFDLAGRALRAARRAVAVRRRPRIPWARMKE